jgi:hypothetical protein
MSTRRLGVLVACEMVALLALLTIAFDQYVHAQVQMDDGLNRWGYRGAVAKRRVYDETRLMMVGGSRAFEPGVPVEQTALARVRFRVQEWVTHDRGPVTAINLGLADLPRGGYAARLEQFRDLEPDVVCVYAELAQALAPLPPSLSMRLFRYAPAAGIITPLDRALGALFAPPALSDDVRDVANAVAVSLTMAPTVVIVPPTASDADSRAREALLASFDRFAGEKRMKLIQLTGDAAVGDQIEPAVSEFLRQRTAPAAAR